MGDLLLRGGDTKRARTTLAGVLNGPDDLLVRVALHDQRPPRERRGWIKMAQEFGYEVQAVFFDVPVEVCVERNTRRGRMVPDDVMQRMAQKLRPPTFDEGFSKITVVHVKKRAHSEPDNVVSGEEEQHGPGIIDENY